MPLNKETKPNERKEELKDAELKRRIHQNKNGGID